ncbi:unnamed protein product [Didymodactylos carnosus]|uniref:Pathogen-related protein n=1 Tax=Didymodactylos carnosus TaxID=1234261 RepID=A0A815KVC3_9BILA|nr:unnamed protein product [Didymodactylos carnosus]CAF1398248.1 unnamed protein product [Didymodactylos carnosus]CAF3971962.1 unnamed protein product [Didymodactylos carnosus]CAF4292241.1 unnamed protein product [Didymodactylos carnosus]
MSLPDYALDGDAVLNEKSTNIVWRRGPPDYSRANSCFHKYKSTNHPVGSLESIVQNIIKNWEKEVSHKTDPKQWRTVDLSNYSFPCNGGPKYSGYEMVKQGTYNALIGETTYYNSAAISFEESHLAFNRALGEGFGWELLELYSGPPVVSFKWKHFGRMTNSFSCPGLSGLIYKADPTNKMVNLFGMCIIRVTEDLRIQDVQIFYDPNQLFTQLTEICPYAPFAKLNVETTAVQPIINSDVLFVKQQALDQRNGSSRAKNNAPFASLSSIKSKASSSFLCTIS